MMNYDSEVIVELFSAMTKQNIVCAYHGGFTYEVVNALLKNAKNDLNRQKMERRAAKKTYNVLVECLENIHKHSTDDINPEDKEAINEGIFVLSHDAECYYIEVGNLIQNKEKDHLKSGLDQVNSLDRDGLKALYKQIIQEGSISEKGGAGLGLIDIALKSGNPIQYNFHQYSENNYFFTLKATIKNQ